LKKEQLQAKNHRKILILGSAESGKNTIMKQLRLCYQQDFTNEEKLAYKPRIYQQVIKFIKDIIGTAVGINLEFNTDMQIIEKLLSLSASPEAWNQQIGEMIEKAWNDPSINTTALAAYKLENSNIATKYYLENIKRLQSVDYIPTNDDILYSRDVKFGTDEFFFQVGNFTLSAIDVGDQCNERRKWIHFFENVDAIFFCASINNYDSKDDKLGVKETINQFESICCTRWFDRTCKILFLSKIDIFKEKISKIDFNVCFPEYTGGLNYENALNFISDKFREKNAGKNELFIHPVMPINTEEMRLIFGKIIALITNKERNIL